MVLQKNPDHQHADTDANRRRLVSLPAITTTTSPPFAETDGHKDATVAENPPKKSETLRVSC